MSIIMKGKKTVSLKKVVDGRICEVEKVLKNELSDGGDHVDFNIPINRYDDLDLSSWFMIGETYSGVVFLSHDGSELTWTTDPVQVDGKYPDNMVWRLKRQEDSDYYTLESRDGYSVQTGEIGFSHVKVTDGGDDVASIRVEDYTFSVDDRDYLRIADHTNGQESYINNAYGYGRYAIWWNDASILYFYEVVASERRLIENVYYQRKEGVSSITGTASDDTTITSKATM